MTAPKKKRRVSGSLSDCAVGIMRERCLQGLGINCTFVDDDMNLLVALAQRAVLAGLDTDADDDARQRMREAAEKVREGHEKALGFAIVPTRSASDLDEQSSAQEAERMA